MALEAGTYIIVPKSNTASAIDVTGGSLDNGSVVGTNYIHWWITQLFYVTLRSDGTWRILNKLVGKALDVPGWQFQEGMYIQLYDDWNPTAQQWNINEVSGETATVNGTAYPVYNINTYDNAWRISNTGQQAGGYPLLVLREPVNGSSANANAQKWAFVPIPPFVDGGVYEIRSLWNNNLALDIAGGSTADGANAQGYAVNGSNAQKFVIVDEGDGFSIRNIASNKYIDVAGGAFATGTNVQSWEDNDSRAQRWRMTQYGTANINGVECAVVTFGAGNQNDYLMDLYMDGSNDVHIWEAKAIANQRWILVPTDAEDPTMPAPYDLGIADAISKQPTSGNEAPWGQTMEFECYPTWKCADAWATDGPNSYQYRYRARYMSASTSTWGDWSEWTSWSTADVHRGGVQSWLTSALEVSYTDSKKLAEVEFAVRSCGVENYKLLYGGQTSEVFRFYPYPAITVTTPSGASWSPEGLRLDASSNYKPGTTYMTIESMVVGGREMLKSPVRVSLDDPFIPQEKLAFVPSENAAVSIVYRAGTDQMPKLSTKSNADTTIAYESGSTTVTPTVTDGNGKTKSVSVDFDGNVRAWVVADGKLYEAPQSSHEGTVTTFDVVYPFNTDYDIFVTGDNGTDWFVWHDDFPADYAGMHVWNWGGSYAMLECREGSPLTVKDSTDAVYEAHILDSRPWETVTFAPTRKRKFSVEGAVIKNKTFSQRADFELVTGIHATYRSPAGDIVDVAVVSVDRESHKRWSEISVEMIQEG